VDYTWTLSHYLSVTGEAEWADKIEQAVYNAGMGSITKDFRSLQYFSSVNQFIATGISNHNIYKHGSTWMAYRPTHETECCSGNVNRMLPNLVSRMWMTDSEGGAVAAIYGPSQATFPTAKGNVTITCETDYPFSETLTFKVSGDKGATIPLTLRIPTWCRHSSLDINGSPLDIYMPAGTFAKVSSGVTNGDVIRLTLPMEVEKKTLKGQGVYFQCGPLLYSYAIPQQKVEDTTEYENMHGKKPENPDFKCWNITPTGAFNYAYADDGQPLEVSSLAIEEVGGTIPYDLNYTPVKVRIPVKQIAWDLVDNRYTPALPEQGHLTLENNVTQYIDLVPYGCTELRLTVFPDADARALAQLVTPDYTRPDDAPDCVTVVDDADCAYFELPRFCWDEPIYCKVRRAGDTTTDLHSSEGGDPCELVGTTVNGRKIWRWVGSSTAGQPIEQLVFTNHDLLTDILPFANSGYYRYDQLLYKANQTIPSSIARPDIYSPSHGDKDPDATSADGWFTLDGRRLANRPTTNGIYIHGHQKVVVNK
jgi:hypothetical protein